MSEEKQEKVKKQVKEKYPSFPWKKRKPRQRAAKESVKAACEQVAMGLLLGKSHKEIAQELGWTNIRVGRLAANDITQKLLRNGTARTFQGAKNQLKERLKHMADAALQTLEQHLNDGNLDAAKEYFKIIGANKEFQGGEADHGIQINIDLGDGKKTLVANTDKTDDKLVGEEVIDVSFDEEKK